MTKEELEALAKLEAEATPGEWLDGMAHWGSCDMTVVCDPGDKRRVGTASGKPFRRLAINRGELSPEDAMAARIRRLKGTQ